MGKYEVCRYCKRSTEYSNVFLDVRCNKLDKYVKMGGSCSFYKSNKGKIKRHQRASELDENSNYKDNRKPTPTKPIITKIKKENN